MNNTEYYLGYNPVWKEYEIIEHLTDRPEGLGCFCFQIGDSGISDGDGFPTSYDDTYVKIDEKVFRNVRDQYRTTCEEMCALAQMHGKPITLPIASGDYIYDCVDFMYIQKISDDREMLWIEHFLYNTYDLDINTDMDVRRN